jgi:iron complex outermembrane receptor protein
MNTILGPILITLLLSAPASLVAQERELEQSDLSLSKILDVKVTVGTFFEERNLDVGSSVSVITSDDWNKRGSRRLNEAIETTPSVSINQFLTEIPVIRGFAKRAVSGTLITIDGIPMNNYKANSAYYSVGDIDLGVLDKIEVLRGPGSSLYGTDAFFGVIALTTHDSKKNETTVTMGGGNYGTYLANLTTSKEIAPNLWWMTAIGANAQQGFSYRRGHYIPDPGTLYDGTDPASLVEADVDGQFKPHDGTQTLVTKFAYKKSEIGYYWNHYNVGGLLVPSYLGGFGEQSQSDAGARALKASDRIDFDSGMQITTTAFVVKDHYGNIQGDVDSAGTFDPKSKNNYEISHANTRQGLSVIARSALAELPLKFAIGYSYDYFKIDQDNEYYRALETLNAKPIQSATEAVNALFVQSNTDFLDNRMHLVLGGRLDQTNTYGSQFTPRLGIIYQTNKTSALKLLYNNAFLAPFAESRVDAGVTKGNPDLKPELLHVYELVYMSQARNFRYELTSYIQRGSNTVTYQDRPDLNPTFLGTFVNNGALESSGLEAEGEFEVNSKLGFMTSASYNQSYETLNNERKLLASFPTYIVNWGVDYKMPLEKLALHMRNRHQFSQNSDFALMDGTTEIRRVDPYFRTDISASWDFSIGDSPFTSSLTVKNLFNHHNKTLPTLFGAYDGGFENSGTFALLQVSANY